jgi:hypothetical protein
MKEQQLKDFCRKSNPMHSEGYYVMKWLGDRYGSVGWYKTKAEAEQEVKRIYSIGAWSGMPPKIEAAVRIDGLRGVRRKNNPMKKLSKSQVLQYFREEVSPRLGNDLPALREAWNNYTDYLHKTKAITTKAYETWVVRDKNLRIVRTRKKNLAKMEKQYTKNPISAEKAVGITKKLIRAYEAYRKENPGKEYHDKKFLSYIRELEKYKTGSQSYIATLAKAYEHLESAKDSMYESVR